MIRRHVLLNSTGSSDEFQLPGIAGCPAQVLQVGHSLDHFEEANNGDGSTKAVARSESEVKIRVSRPIEINTLTSKKKCG